MTTAYEKADDIAAWSTSEDCTKDENYMNKTIDNFITEHHIAI